jgi:phenylacetate-CoA ligase
MEKYFGVPVLSRYSNIENGIIAQQMPESGANYIINWASYFVEILDLENDTALEHGKPGRIVITDLFNYAMPLIRYDTGDIGSMGLDSNGNPVLTLIQGRKLDTIYNTKGEVFSSAIIWELEYYNNIKQFQLIQTGEKSYTFKLSVDGKFTESEKLVERFKNHLGLDALITIEEIDEIPVLASGKRRLVVNQFQKQLLSDPPTPS